MRDWSSTLSPASLAGVPFRVRSDEIEAGRRHAVHTIPNGGHVVEEFGPAPRSYRVTAYCAGDSADAEALRLLALDGVAGPHLLILPTTSAMVVIDKISRGFERDALGLITVSISCVDAGAVGMPGFGLADLVGLSLAALDNLVFAAADLVFDGLGLMADLLLGGLPLAVVDLADGLVGAALDGLALVEMVRDGALSSALAFAADFVLVGFDGLPSLAEVLVGETVAGVAAEFLGLADDIVGLAADAALLITDPLAWAPRLGAIVRAIGDRAEPETWPSRAADIVEAKPTLATPAYATARTRAVAAAAAIVPALVRVAALATTAEAAVRRDYVDRASAVAVRSRLAESFAAEIDRLSVLSPVPRQMVEALVGLRDATVTALTRRATTLAPVVTITAPREAPALVWAWRLYRDPTRAREIAARNGVSHPGYIPTTFEALAR